LTESTLLKFLKITCWSCTFDWSCTTGCSFNQTILRAFTKFSV